MNLSHLLEAARGGRLYPAVILCGGSAGGRTEAAIAVARTLLCGAPAGERPCGACAHCRRIVAPPERGDGPFHPDFRWLGRDLKTSTSVDATKALLQAAQMSPFEARGQVFVLGDAETLSLEAENALLKILEEPPVRAPRHFLLLAPSRQDLLPTVRSRSLTVWLGPVEPLDAAAVEEAARGFARACEAFRRDGAPIHLLRAAGHLLAGADWSDPRATRPWSTAAAAVRRAAGEELGAADSSLLLALAADLLAAPEFRLRGIPAERLIEGLVSRRLGARSAEPAAIGVL